MKSLIVNNTKCHDIIEFPMPKKILEFVKFTTKGVEFYYRNEVENFSVSYADVLKMKLIFVGDTFNHFRGYFLKSFILNFVVLRNNKSLSINLFNNEFKIKDTIFKIIYFSKYIGSFSYDFRNGKQDSSVFDKAIKSYINNGYKHTFGSIGCTKWGFPLLVSFFLLGILLLIFISWLIILH